MHNQFQICKIRNSFHGEEFYIHLLFHCFNGKCNQLIQVVILTIHQIALENHFIFKKRYFMHRRIIQNEGISFRLKIPGIFELARISISIGFPHEHTHTHTQLMILDEVWPISFSIYVYTFWTAACEYVCMCLRFCMFTCSKNSFVLWQNVQLQLKCARVETRYTMGYWKLSRLQFNSIPFGCLSDSIRLFSLLS